MLLLICYNKVCVIGVEGDSVDLIMFSGIIFVDDVCFYVVIVVTHDSDCVIVAFLFDDVLGLECEHVRQVNYSYIITQKPPPAKGACASLSAGTQLVG